MFLVENVLHLAMLYCCYIASAIGLTSLLEDQNIIYGTDTVCTVLQTEWISVNMVQSMMSHDESFIIIMILCKKQRQKNSTMRAENTMRGNLFHSSLGFIICSTTALLSMCVCLPVYVCGLPTCACCLRESSENSSGPRLGPPAAMLLSAPYVFVENICCVPNEMKSLHFPSAP